MADSSVSASKDGEFDSLFLALRWNGPYQLVQLFILLFVNIPLAFSLMSVIFVAYRAEPHCTPFLNKTLLGSVDDQEDLTDLNVTYSSCGADLYRNLSVVASIPCESYQYDVPREFSLASEWDLVCGKESLLDLLATLHILGNGVGALIFTTIADRWGRKTANLLGGTCLLIVTVAMSFLPSYTPFAVLKIAQGACQMGTGLTSVALTLEIIPTKQRSLVGSISAMIWALSIGVYAVAAYLMRNIGWRNHQLVTGLSAVYFIILPWILDESSRWLGTRRRYDDIERILRKAARMNGKKEEEIVALFKQKIVHTRHEEMHPLSTDSEIVDELIQGESKTDSVEKRPVLQIFKDRQILKIALVLWFTWFTDSLTYFSLQLSSTEFHSDRYIGFGLSAIMEVASSTAYWLTIDRFGRRNSSMAFHFLAGTSLILSVVFGHFTAQIPSLSAAVTTFSLIGKFAVTTTFNILWIYTPEIFPTNIRNIAFGLSSLAARFGGIIAPFSKTLYQYYPWAPGSIFGAFCILVTLLMRSLPETAGSELCQTIEEMRVMIKNKGRKSNHEPLENGK